MLFTFSSALCLERKWLVKSKVVILSLTCQVPWQFNFLQVFRLSYRRENKRRVYFHNQPDSENNLKVRPRLFCALSLPWQVWQKPKGRAARRRDRAEGLQQEQDGGNSGHRRGNAQNETGTREVSICVPLPAPAKSLSIKPSHQWPEN